MDTSAEETTRVNSETTTLIPKELALRALEANQAHQCALAKRAKQLSNELQELDALLNVVQLVDAEEDAETEIDVPGAKKAVGPCAPGEFLNRESPFFADASRRSRFVSHMTDHPMKPKELEALVDAVRRENQRLQACQSQSEQRQVTTVNIDVDNNTEGLDWTVIAEKVSNLSNSKRSPDECRTKWLGDRHPKINHDGWKSTEIERLKDILSSQVGTRNGKVDWDDVASKLGTNRTAIDCMRHGIPRQRHTWNSVFDDKLLDAVKLYGIDNWNVVARYVSEDATAAQCQWRYVRTLDPSLKRGVWSQEEDARLKLAVEAYGNSWVAIAACIPGRTNQQCRERWNETLYLNASVDTWTEEEDKTLLKAASVLGKQWKVISVKMGNGRAPPHCRIRYDRLTKPNTQHSSAYASSSALQSETTQNSGEEIGGSPHVQQKTANATANEDTNDKAKEPPVPKPRPRPKPIGKGKSKAKPTASQLTPPDSSMPTVPNSSSELSPPATEDATPTATQRGRKRGSTKTSGENASPAKKRATKKSLTSDIAAQDSRSLNVTPVAAEGTTPAPVEEANSVADGNSTNVGPPVTPTAVRPRPRPRPRLKATSVKKVNLIVRTPPSVDEQEHITDKDTGEDGLALTKAKGGRKVVNVISDKGAVSNK